MPHFAVRMCCRLAFYVYYYYYYYYYVSALPLVNIDQRFGGRLRAAARVVRQSRPGPVRKSDN